MRFVLMASLVFCQPALAAPPPSLAASIAAESDPVTLAKIGGKWIKAETATVAATVHIDTAAKWCQVRVARIVTVTIDGQAIDVVTASPVEVLPIDVAKGKCFGIIAAPGQYQATITVSDPKSGISQEVRRIAIGGPEPTPPTPPPAPVVDAPFESSGYAVLMIREASGVLSPTQTSIFQSSAIHKYIGGKAVKLSDGQPFYRAWDDDYSDAELSNVPGELRAAYSRVTEDMDSLPWIAIVGKDGKSGYSGPLPADVDSTMALLKKYGE